MSAWKMKLLSRASRLILIQLVCRALPTYTMHTCQLPKITLGYNGEDYSGLFVGGYRREKISTSCSLVRSMQTEGLGGLGMRLLRDTNRVLLAKLVWKWLKNPKALWVRILKAKYSNILDEN